MEIFFFFKKGRVKDKKNLTCANVTVLSSSSCLFPTIVQINSILYKESFANTVSWFSLAVFNMENSLSSQTNPNFAQILRTREYCKILSMSREVVDSLGCVSCLIPVFSVSWDQGLWFPIIGEGICLLRLPAWCPIKRRKIRPHEPFFSSMCVQHQFLED